jgi:chromosome partitioning protein
MGSIVAFANQKGGVGKTTTVINLAAALAELDWTVLLVDLDPQANLTAGLGTDPGELEYALGDLLLSRRIGFDEILVESGIDGVNLAPSNIELAKFDINVARERGRERILAERLREVADDYDLVFIDCPPAFNLLTVNALTAADYVVVPVQCYFYSLQGLASLASTISDIRDAYNGDLEVLGVLATAAETGTNISRLVIERLQEQFGEQVFSTVIRKSVKVAEAPMYGKSLLAMSPSHDVSRAYRELAEEFVGRL